MALTSKQATKILVDIEKNVSVNKLKFSGVSIWPLLRLEIWIRLRNDPDDNEEKNKSRVVFFSFLRVLCKKYLSYFIPTIRALKGIIKGDTVRKKDVCFLSIQYERRIKIEGKYYSIFADTLKERLEKYGIESLNIDLYDSLSMYKEPSYNEPFPIEFCPLFHLSKIVELNRLKYSPKSIEGWNSLDRYISNNIPQIQFEYNEAIRACNLLLAHKIAFKRFLKIVQPETCFLIGYYHVRAMAFIWACRELKIKVVEVQHGQQGDYNGMLTHWNKVPRNGYELLPDYFWSWGKGSADRINKYFSKCKVHKALVGGHPWLAKCLETPISTKKDKEKVFLNNLKLTKKIKVLVALQPEKETISKTLFEAIKNSPSNIQWMIRLHPVMFKRINEINKILRKTRNENVEIELSSSISLYNLLKYADFCVTLWSSVAYEALVFGVHPIIIDKNGFDIFKKYIDLKLFSKATNDKQLLQILCQTKSSFLRKEKVNYIETSFSIIDGLLLKLIK